MKLPVSGRVAAAASLVLGFTGVMYWIPALFGGQPSSAADSHPVAFIQRVASMAQDQYTPQMGILIPILGVLFTLASAAQIPAALGALTGRDWGRVVLRAVAYTKVGLYVTSGLLLGLAIFSSVRPADPRWNFLAGHWLANLAMIGVYYWVVVALRDPGTAALPADEEEENDETEEQRAGHPA
jgi:hypothetical protein